jgi:hypothetical protein
MVWITLPELKFSRLADHFPNSQIKEVVLMSGFYDQGGIGSSSGSPDRDDIASAQGAGIGRHDGHLHGNFYTLAEKSQGICNNQHWIGTGMFFGD